MDYLKVRKIKKLKTISQIGIAIILSVISILLTLAYFSQNVGSFTIFLSEDMFYRGLSLSETSDFSNPSSKLAADVLNNAYPIGQVGYPEEFPLVINLEEIINSPGPKNGADYIAYSFYLKNAGQEMVDYSYSININSSSKGVVEAIRIAIISAEDIINNEIDVDSMRIFAKRQTHKGAYPGDPEPGSIPFHSHERVNLDYRYNLDVGEVDRYIIILWLHGEDPDCDDDIIDGSIKLSMNFNILE